MQSNGTYLCSKNKETQCNEEALSSCNNSIIQTRNQIKIKRGVNHKRVTYCERQRICKTQDSIVHMLQKKHVILY